MDVEQEFEEQLKRKGLAGAEQWVEDWMVSHPWDHLAKACRSFVYALKENPKARAEIHEVLRVSPFNDWALVALFILEKPCTDEEIAPFMGWSGFRLDPSWIALLWDLGYSMQSFMLWATFLIHGTDEQKVFLETEYKDIPDWTISKLDEEHEKFMRMYKNWRK